ncbi:MAG: efflux RND transporter permease subunit, partial [Acidobacteria bacterium]|nr:efflux RND transporter permease subunit [Acidobacteriota bacterium]
SLNIMSLGGLTLGIGLLVDNAIVVLEAVQRRRDKGADLTTAALAGTKEVSTAIVASTITSICVFLPIVFVEGVAAQFFSDQALTVTYSLLISLLVALTVIPMLASRQFHVRDADDEEHLAFEDEETKPGLKRRITGSVEQGGFFVALSLARLGKGIGRGIQWLAGLIFDPPARLFQKGFDGLAAGYDRLLAWALGHKAVTLLVALVALGGSLALYPSLGQELVPEVVQGEFFVDVELPPGTHLDVTQRRMALLERKAAGLPGVAQVYSLVGTSRQQGGSAAENRENHGQLAVTVAEPFSREKEERLMARLRQELAAEKDLELRFGRPSFFSFQTPVELEIRGFNLRQLRRFADLA